MKIGQITSSRAVPYLALMAIWILLGLFLHSFAGGSPSKPHWEKRWWNEETALHTLNTLGRYHLYPISQHWFAITAPRVGGIECVTFESPCVKSEFANQPGTAVAASPRLDGAAVYTSFPPGSMIISSLFVYPLSQAAHISPLSAIRIWNWFLALATALIFCATLQKAIKPDTKYKGLLVTLSCLPLLVAVEPMHSHHQSLWAHQVMQPIIALVLFLFTSVITRRRAALLGLACFVGCWVEWTSYLLCIAVFFGVILKSLPKDRAANGLIFAVIAMAGGLTLLGYYSLLVGIKPYFAALLDRFSTRTVTVDYYNWGDWTVSLFQSFGPWLVSILVLSLINVDLAKIGLAKTETATASKLAAPIAIATVILIENVLMFEHAIVYTFDRLKWGFLIGLLLLFFGEKLTSKNSRVGVLIVGLVCIGAMIGSYFQFTDIYKPYWK